MSLGFDGAPVTQILSIIVLLTSLFFGSSSLIMMDDIPSIADTIWRLLLSQLIFSSMAQTFVGLLLLYCFRQFERQMGSRKFGFFVIFSYLLSFLSVFCTIIIFQAFGNNYFPAPGFFSLIFSCLSLYYSKSIYIFFRLMITEFKG